MIKMAGSMFGKLDLSNPGVLISMFIGVSIAVQVITTVFPDLIAELVSLASLGNFSFATFFSTGGIVLLILSAVILFGIFAILGVNLKGSKR